MRYHSFGMVLCFWLVSMTLCLEWYQENNPHFINDHELKELLDKDHSTIKIVKFFTPWCKYCRFMKDYFDGYRKSHQIDDHLKIYEFNCDASMNACTHGYRVSGFPTVLAYDKGGKELTRFSGMYPEQFVYQFITNMNKKAIALSQ